MSSDKLGTSTSVPLFPGQIYFLRGVSWAKLCWQVTKWTWARGQWQRDPALVRQEQLASATTHPHLRN
uniref:Uncharacterized protein n=1 Tax=Triticum urartu TaxID=4572 RepID=A0A8R7PDI6_TRIUA